MLKHILTVVLLASLGGAQPDRLDSWYCAYNHMYFNDELPQTVVISHNLTDDRYAAQTELTGGTYHIEFNPKFNLSGKAELMTLLHEQCHIQVGIEHKYEFTEHGPHWQACMQDLAKKGAFASLW